MSDEHKPHDSDSRDAAQDHENPAAEATGEPGSDVRVDEAPAPDEAAPEASAAADSSGSRVWSDSREEPFEDVNATPVYARGKDTGKRKVKEGPTNEGLEIFKTIFFALLIALVLRVVLFQPFTIPSASMEPALYEGDYIVVSKWSYGYSKHSIPFSPPIFEGRILATEPERGDIVVFKLPRDNQTDYIKRLMGLPGDRIQMIANVLHINGTPLQNVVVTGADVTNMYGMPVVTMRETLPEGRIITIQDYGPGNDLDDTPMFEVPAGHYFMMGDNRDNSIDSRVIDPSLGVGLVPSENLIGKAEIILFSWTPGASLWNPVSWFANVRPSRFFNVLD
jgi:signal peptidase I